MTEPPVQPRLTPQFCFNTVAVRDFLRISRSAIDDSITQNLNALITPSSTGFDPYSTSQRTHRPLSRRQINHSSCSNFKEKVLFPSWQARSDVLTFCAKVATSPDPDDPGATSRQVEEARNRVRVVDDRLDPYSSRFFPSETRAEKLLAVIRQEKVVENIVRARTWGMVVERCEEEITNWEVALGEWQKNRKNMRRDRYQETTAVFQRKTSSHQIE